MDSANPAEPTQGIGSQPPGPRRTAWHPEHLDTLMEEIYENQDNNNVGHGEVVVSINPDGLRGREHGSHEESNDPGSSCARIS